MLDCCWSLLDQLVWRVSGMVDLVWVLVWVLVWGVSGAGCMILDILQSVCSAFESYLFA